MPYSSILTLATAVAGASAAFQGFNYDNKGRSQGDFEKEFNNARNLEGTNGAFTSARLYTMIQDGTANDPISAIPAAISTKTSLLFGLWASGGQEAFNNELAALKKTAEQYCGKLDGLVAGISVGSEDLYRDSPIGQAAGENPGASPDVLSKYVDETRKAIKGTCLEKAPIGHVDTWTAYANQTNRQFSNTLDWVGMDAYPYYENQKDNSIENAAKLFQAAIDNTNAGTGNKPLWITETGWPVSGKTENKAQAGLKNAQAFWRAVGCPRFGKVNTWWFTQHDGGPSDTSAPRFGVVGPALSTKPLFDLSCDGSDGGSNNSNDTSSSSTQASMTETATGTEASRTISVPSTLNTSVAITTGTRTGNGGNGGNGSNGGGSGGSGSNGGGSGSNGGGSGSNGGDSGSNGGGSGGNMRNGGGNGASASSTSLPTSNAVTGLGSTAAAIVAIMVAVASL